MILTDKMLLAAFRYRETMLWEDLDDSNLFAFRLSDGEIGYCCVMGNAGEHISLGFYRGDHGFASYLKSINLGMVPDMEMMETALSFDCINCDFMNSADTQELSKEDKARIREFAKANGFKIRRPKGWPDFTRRTPYKVPSSILEERDALDITEALNAAVAVAERIQSEEDRFFLEEALGACGFDENREYPSRKGGKVVPYLIPQEDGTYEWSTTTLPAMPEDTFPKPEYANQIMANQLKGLAHNGTLRCRAAHILSPVKDDETGTLYYPMILLCVAGDARNMFPVMSPASVETAPEKLLHEFASILLGVKKCPAVIEVADERTKALLGDFCKKTGIKLKTVKHLPEVDEALEFMMAFM